MQTDHDLFTSMKAGNQDSLWRLLRRYHDRLLTRIRRKLPGDMCDEDAEDILQQTYVGVFRDIEAFEPRSEHSFFRWLTVIAEHRILDAVKSQRCKKRGGEFRRQSAPIVDGATDGSYDNLVDLLAGGAGTASSQLAREEVVLAVRFAHASLPDDYRQAIKLHHLEGMTLAEVASHIDRPTDAVRGVLYRARKKMRDALGRSSLYFDRK